MPSRHKSRGLPRTFSPNVKSMGGSRSPRLGLPSVIAASVYSNYILLVFVFICFYTPITTNKTVNELYSTYYLLFAMVVIDLKVNSSLLDLKFEGYKLSLDPIPILKQSLIDGVRTVGLKNEEYSFIQTHLNLSLNHLFQDPWNQNTVFYINTKNSVIWMALGQDGRLSNPRCAWEIASDLRDKKSVTISFPSVDWAVLCNGKGHLSILYTPSRAAGEPWMCCYSFDLKMNNSCYLLHASHRYTPGGQQLDCVVATTDYSSNLPKDFPISNDRNSVALLEWSSLSCGQNNQEWTIKRTRKLVGSTYPEYVAIDNVQDAICIVSQSDYVFYFDSDGLVYNSQVSEEKKVSDQHKYSYLQTPEDITVYFRVPIDTKKTDVQINFEAWRLEVLVRGKCFLSGMLSNTIDTTGSTWTLDGEKLELILSKAEVGLMWRELVKGNNEGKEIMDKALVEEIQVRLAHLTSENEVNPSNKVPFNLDQLEECDAPEEQIFFQRIDGNEHKETHKINFGGHQWLFSKQIHPENLPAICLRYDVDGILWQPKNVSGEGELDNFKIVHSTTFSALGYVSASKQDKKFTDCCPEFKYAVISDCARHLYVYCQPETLHSSLELRNRKTGESIDHIAKQYVVALEDCDRIMGLRTSPQCIFVLSKNMLYAVKIASK